MSAPLATLKISVRKLRRPVPADPTATLIAHAKVIYPDYIETHGAWFGTDEPELRASVEAWFAGAVATVRGES